MNDDERDYDEEQYNAELCPACGISPCPGLGEHHLPGEDEFAAVTE